MIKTYGNLMASRKGKVKGDSLNDYARLTASKYGKNFTMVTDDTSKMQFLVGKTNQQEEVISFICRRRWCLYDGGYRNRSYRW